MQDIVEQNQRNQQNQQQQSQHSQQIQQQMQAYQQHQSYQQQQKEAITNALSQMTFAKTEADYDKDIKMAFAFDTEFSHLTDDKSTNSDTKTGLCLPRSSSVIHSTNPASHNTISPSTAYLNMKIASVKKVCITSQSSITTTTISEFT